MKFFDFIYIGICCMGCSGVPEGTDLTEGDLLFQVGRGSAMSGAIAAATGTASEISYTHVAIAVGSTPCDSVLEASSERGVSVTALAEFLDRSARGERGPLVRVMRLRDTTGLAASVARARNCIGQPYDYAYGCDNGKMYCSELVWESYRRRDGSRIFSARPMNFRAADGTMPAFWTELFDRLGEPIPEGEPGTNPNDMSRDTALVERFRYF